MQRPLQAFTLLEIMIALAILALLIGLAIGNTTSIFGDAQVTTTRLFLKDSIELPLTRYRLNLGDYPSTAEGLRALLVAPAGQEERWRGPYLEDTQLPRDAWGSEYIYRYPGIKNKGGYDIFSKGPDRTEGTADDIGNWTDDKP